MTKQYVPNRGAAELKNSPKRVALGKWLRQQREAKGLTMREMQSLSGKPHSYFGKIEQAQRGLDVLEFLELCAWLGIDATESVEVIQAL